MTSYKTNSSLALWTTIKPPWKKALFPLSKDKKKFLRFIVMVCIGFALGAYFTRKGFHLTPESFQTFVLSLGILGPIIYIGVFIVRPLFLIPSIALFIGGGLAFGPGLGSHLCIFGGFTGRGCWFLVFPEKWVTTML